jgi:Skp family chaperone for outer membrane proteins
MIRNLAQARKARAIAEIAAGNVGFLARIIQAGGNAELRAIGHQADAELQQRDRIIASKEREIEALRAELRRSVP